MSSFIGIFGERIDQDSSLAPNTKERRKTAIKAVTTTWPGLSGRDVRRITVADCRSWGAKALREGTGFLAPNVKTKGSGMSASAFNQAVDALRAVLAIACEQGVIYKNPAADVTKAPVSRKRLALPCPEQFQAIAMRIAVAGSEWSQDCADLVRLLAFSGVRLRELPQYDGAT
ncbi:MAG: hypothetical protein ABIS43_16005 [Opitutus sp.]